METQVGMAAEPGTVTRLTGYRRTAEPGTGPRLTGYRHPG